MAGTTPTRRVKMLDPSLDELCDRILAGVSRRLAQAVIQLTTNRSDPLPDRCCPARPTLVDGLEIGRCSASKTCTPRASACPAVPVLLPRQQPAAQGGGWPAWFLRDAGLCAGQREPVGLDVPLIWPYWMAWLIDAVTDHPYCPPRPGAETRR